jgi:DNA-binding NtrC family response regulator
MSVIENKSSVKTRSIAQKLEAINQIANIVLSEVKTFHSEDSSGTENINYYEEIQRFEIELILYALYRAKGNQRRAARILNIKPTTLNAKVKKFNLTSAAPLDKGNLS